MKLIKLLLASLLLAGYVQAKEFTHHKNYNNVQGYIAGLVSGIVIYNALTPRYDKRATYVVYKERDYHRPHFARKHHMRKRYHHFRNHRRDRF